MTKREMAEYLADNYPAAATRTREEQIKYWLRHDKVTIKTSYDIAVQRNAK